MAERIADYCAANTMLGQLGMRLALVDQAVGINIRSDSPISPQGFEP